VKKKCYGFSALAERVEQYPPEKVAKITWISAEKIIEIARFLAQNRPCIIVNGMELEQQRNAICGIHAKFILSMLMGSIDVPGGEYLPGPAKCVNEAEMECSDRLSPK